jgi:hypothetical protein
MSDDEGDEHREEDNGNNEHVEDNENNEENENGEEDKSGDDEDGNEEEPCGYPSYSARTGRRTRFLSSHLVIGKHIFCCLVYLILYIILNFLFIVFHLVAGPRFLW